MNPDAYWQVFLGGLAGAVTGALIAFHRRRTRVAGPNRLRDLGILALGTSASAYALVSFGRAFGNHSPAFAVLVVISTTGWTALVNSVVRLPVPRCVLRVRPAEFSFLHARWTGVRLFGVFLRSAPIRPLGGRIYLASTGGDAVAVLRGLHDAETVHLWALLLGLPWLVFWAAQGRWSAVLWALAIHAPLNLYPVLHLRCVTWRLERHIAKLPASAAPLLTVAKPKSAR